MIPSISFIVPTVGRPSLQATLRSIEAWDEDEVLAVKLDPPGNNWGNAERQRGQDLATCDYVAFIDDDDTYVPGHRAIMAAAIEEHPGKPLIFRIEYPNGTRLWRPSNRLGRPPRIKNGNISSQMFVFPNDKVKLSKWRQTRGWKARAGDFYWIAESGWGNRGNYIWREEVICLMGHDDPYIFVNNKGRLRPGVFA